MHTRWTHDKSEYSSRCRAKTMWPCSVLGSWYYKCILNQWMSSCYPIMHSLGLNLELTFAHSAYCSLPSLLFSAVLATTCHTQGWQKYIYIFRSTSFTQSCTNVCMYKRSHTHIAMSLSASRAYNHSRISADMISHWESTVCHSSLWHHRCVP